MVESSIKPGNGELLGYLIDANMMTHCCLTFPKVIEAVCAVGSDADANCTSDTSIDAGRCAVGGGNGEPLALVLIRCFDSNELRDSAEEAV